MSMLEAMRRNYMYIGNSVLVLYDKYEPHSEEFLKTALYLNMTDIPWRGIAHTGEIYWSSWCRIVINRVSLIGCPV